MYSAEAGKRENPTGYGIYPPQLPWKKPAKPAA
jgi:hypothetical protein